MKQKILIIIFASVAIVVRAVAQNSDGIAINSANFPDDNFRSYVSSSIDKNSDGYLSNEEIAAVTSISVNYKRISSLKGVEYFTGLLRLHCYNNQLSTLDISKNTSLNHLECSSNQLTSLDVSKNTALTNLGCGGNQLTELDVSKNVALEALGCYGNRLASLDVSKNVALKSLSCGENQLTSLDLSKNVALEAFDCPFNQLTSLDVSKNVALEAFDCSSNQLASLDVSKNVALEAFDCSSNQLTSLDVSKNINLNWLTVFGNSFSEASMDALSWSLPIASLGGDFIPIDISSNVTEHNVCSTIAVQMAKAKGWTVTAYNSNGDLEEYEGTAPTCGIAIDAENFPDAQFREYVGSSIVDKNSDGYLSEFEVSAATSMEIDNKHIATLKGIEYFTALTNLSCGGNQLTVLDVSKNTALTNLSCGGNQLASLDVSKNIMLTTLYCRDNQLTALYVSNNSALATLQCDYNYLSTLDVSKNTALTNLRCNNNQLTELNASNCIALIGLDCYSNQLTTLDISSCTALKSLNCYSNQLTTLDVSGCIALRNMFCYDNKLTVLNASNCTELIRLDCNSNQLTTLDISSCTALKSLNCYSNLLTTLDISGCTALTSLNCYGNQLTTLDASNCTALRSLSCSYNQLTMLNVSGFTALTSLYCSNNHLTSLDVSDCIALNTLVVSCNNIGEVAMNALAESLPEVMWGGFYVINPTEASEKNVCSTEAVATARSKGWKVRTVEGEYLDGVDYEGTTPTIYGKQEGVISYAITIVTKTFGDETFTNELTLTGDGTVSYASSNETVATVDSSTGEVTIVGVGTTTITATATDGTDYEYENPTASYELTVRDATMTVTSEGYTGTYDGTPHGITVSAPEGATIKYGESKGNYYLATTPTYTDAGSYSVYFEVTMENYETLAGSENIVIEKAEGTLSYAETEIEKSMDDTAPFTNELALTGDGTATFASSDETVAEVDATTGEVTILSDGTTTITATATDGKNYAYATPTASYELTVKAASGIEGVRGSDSMAHGYYSIDGWKLTAVPTKKGVYVKDGRKIVIK